MESISKIVVRYAETDQMGIAHHSNYPIWYEVARTDCIKKIGMSYSQMEKCGVMLPLVKLDCHYLYTACYEDELELTVSIKTLTPVRVEFYYEVFNITKDKLINKGCTLHAFTDTNLKIVNMKKLHNELYTLIMAAKDD